jgi:uncharacterized protein
MASRFLLIWVCCFSLAAQNKRAVDEPTTLLVHGEATVSVEPDIAELDVGVLTQGQTSQAATDDNATKAKQLVAELQRLVAPGDIKAVNFSVNPNYRYGKNGGAAELTGYTASNTVRAVIRDLSQLRKVIEAATQGGASSINRLTFDLKDEKSARARALADAAGQAQSGAEALASALNVRIGKLIRIEEVQPVVISPARELEVAALREAVSNQAAIAPGTIQIHASVNLVYAVNER